VANEVAETFGQVNRVAVRVIQKPHGWSPETTSEPETPVLLENKKPDEPSELERLPELKATDAKLISGWPGRTDVVVVYGDNFQPIGFVRVEEFGVSSAREVFEKYLIRGL
jgi:hypothetical protein